MSHIFISYSRKDIDFAGQIVDALAENKLDAWIDWKSIPKGEVWEQEIYRGIEEADAFLFLISPASVQSEMCNKEIAHAVINNKRLIPILIRDAGPKNVPPAVSELNWIFCREAIDNFDNAIQEIYKTIHTDWEWVKYHTKLQSKALDWERRKDNSRLLRGKELREAEQQLANAGRKDPQPTDLQRQYVLAGRKDEERRRRGLTIGLALGLAVLAILCLAAVISSFIAVGQRNEAVSQANARATAQANAEEEANARATAQTNAEEQANIALARQLAVQAQLIFNKEAGGPVIASLLANESEQRYPNADADQVLRDSSSLLLIPSQNNSMKQDGIIISLTFSPDGKWIASGGYDNTARIWDAKTGYQIARLQLSGTVTEVKFSPESTRVFTASEDGTVCVWDVQTGQQVLCKNHGEGITYMDISPDGKRVVSGGMDGIARVWDAQTGNEIRHMINNGAVLAVAFSPDGKLIASSSEDNIVKVWDSTTGDEVAHRTYQSSPGSQIGFSPDGKRILTGDYYSPAVEVWDANTGSLITDFGLIEGIGLFSPDGKLIATRERSGSIQIWNSETGKMIAEMSHDFTVESFVFSPDGKYLVSGSDDGSARLWDVMTGHEIGRMLQDGQVLAVAFSPNGDFIASAGVDKVIHLWSVPSTPNMLSPSKNSTLLKAKIDPRGNWIASWSEGGATLQILNILQNSELTQINVKDTIVDMDFSSTGQVIVSLDGNGVACVWETSGGQKIICQPQNSEVRKVKFFPDSNSVISVGDKTLWIWDSKTGTEITRLVSDYSISLLAISPDGKLIALGAVGDSKIDLWDVTTLNKIAEFRHDPSVKIDDLVFTKDGKWLISSGIDGTARVWDLGTLQEVSRLTYDYHEFPNMDQVLQTAISPDQKRLASVNTIEHMTASGDPTTPRESTIRVWDPISGQEISRMVNNSWVTEIIWSPNGQYVFSAGLDGVVRMWDAINGNEIARIIHNSIITQLAFTSNGTQIISISSDGIYKVSYWKPKDIIAQACSQVTRNLTLLEWKQYFGEIPYRATCPNPPLPQN
jgi:WD40 repeat protein